MVKKKVLAAERIRQIRGGFSFIPHRFLTDGFLAALGQKPALSIEIKEAAPTQAQAVAQIKAGDVDAVFLAGYETEGYILLPELREACVGVLSWTVAGAATSTVGCAFTTAGTAAGALAQALRIKTKTVSKINLVFIF